MREFLNDPGLTNQLYKLYTEDQSFVFSNIIREEWKPESLAFIKYVLSPSVQDALTTRFHSQSASIYTRFMLENLNYKKLEELHEIAATLIHPERPRLHTPTLEALKRRTVMQETQLHPKVARGRKFLREYLKDLTLPSGAVILLYGSLQYNDPRDLDADIMIAFPRGVRPNQAQADRMDSLLGNELIRVWKDYQIEPRSEPHASLVSTSSVDTFTFDIVRNRGQEADDTASKIAIALSGMALYPDSNVNHASIQQQIRSSVEHEPLLTILVNQTLGDCLEVRKKRQR